MIAILSSGSLMATHDYNHHLCSTSSNSSCGSAKYPGEPPPRGPAVSSGSPLSHSWPQCWSSQSTQSLPRFPPA
ncbi:pancreatic progenitor cell differentiation and proliferation factor-like [Bos indicus]|uniref:Pancreatic progenitor cell differentiation and proliferation factor-like n=1 Tax=Bos indicus TaxID=9915 RepID=A0ABM4RXG1_BOSIN|nr:pancreatic progenitor cell differentiation and proliferation factor-like [Bos taurus]XP_027390499.1 pancreatic progenitor cell differentiation and proliferation factor-like [Bos indicus x Bos taurus]XP_061264545.1 pancreatic progenitor cell differentiation and proliferation factor-like [Bos javanicus]